MVSIYKAAQIEYLGIELHFGSKSLLKLAQSIEVETFIQL